MKILFLAHRIPYPPNKGDKIRSFNELRALARRGHEIHLRAFADDLRDLELQSDLMRWCASVEVMPLRKWRAMLNAGMALIGGRPLSVGYYASRRMRKSVRRLMGDHEFDAVFVFSSTMAQYVPQSLATRTVLDMVDVDSEKWRVYAGMLPPPQSWKYRIEWPRLRRYEYQTVLRFAYTVLTTPNEAALLADLDEFTRRARLRTITNGVDLEQYQPNDSLADDYFTSSPRIVFVGAMDYFANVEGVRWFVEQVLPLVRRAEPRAEFFIVGSKPTEEVLRLGSHEGVKVTGFVRDISPYLHSATVCVIPLQIARGVQNKMLEAMATGKAVVATREAAAGLARASGRGGLRSPGTAHEAPVLIADDPQLFADAVLTVIRDENLRERLGWQARQYVELEHDWNPLLDKFTKLIETAGARPRPSQRAGLRAITGS